MSETNYYAGIGVNGNKHYLWIEGQVWEFKRTKFTNAKFNDVAVGQRFSMESELNDDTLTIDWETFQWETGQVESEEVNKQTLHHLAGKRLKTIKSASKKINAENLGNMTLNEIKYEYHNMNKQQQAATLAIIMSHMGWF
jgi:hypothetical protein